MGSYWIDTKINQKRKHSQSEKQQQEQNTHLINQIPCVQSSKMSPVKTRTCHFCGEVSIDKKHWECQYCETDKGKVYSSSFYRLFLLEKKGRTDIS